ncbi:MFS transporter [Nocardiopsis potens]|uniref:MFS transporter n=1 Tax=Nocardiopsis potens TaxID=1246458 RepID=UPI00037A42DE|nr:MFS transporter [Nocardiopsis potens]
MASERRLQRTTPPDRTAVRARAAVAVLFAVNGFAYTNVVPWLPALKSGLGLSNTELGAAIAALPFGALLTGMLAGPLIARWGSGRASVAAGVLVALVLPLVAFAPGWWALALALFAIGCGDAWMDAAMNTHGLRVQQRYGRTIINTFHAVWSVAAVCGGLAGSAAAGTGLPLPVHLAAASLVLLAALAWAGRNLLPEEGGGAEPEAPGEAPEGRPAGAAGRLRSAAGALRGAAPLLLALSLLLMAAGAIEDSAASWGAVYMRTELGAAAFLAGMPFVACQAMMTVGRLTGDRLTDRFGAAAVVRAGALVSAAGVAVAVLVPSQAAGIAGFGLLGLGVATLFPLTLAAAGAVPGVRSGDGVAVVGWLGRVGFLAFPPMIGAIADAASLGAALWTVAAAGLLAAALAGAVRPRPAPR